MALKSSTYMKIVQEESAQNFLEPWNLSDFQLVFDEGTLHVHKGILAVASPVFNSMLQSEYKESKESSMRMPGKTMQEVTLFLQHIYPPFPPPLTEEDCAILLPLAEEYLIKKLTQRIEHFLCCSGTVSVDSLLIGQRFSLASWLQRCYSEMPGKLDFQNLKKHSRYDEIDKEQLTCLFESYLQAAYSYSYCDTCINKVGRGSSWCTHCKTAIHGCFGFPTSTPGSMFGTR